MTLRFRRTLKLGPLKLHFGTRGVGLSMGVRGAHLGLDSRGKPYASFGLPGTGLYVKSELKK